MNRKTLLCIAAPVIFTQASALHAMENDAALSNVTSRSVGEAGGPNPEDTFTRMFPDLPPFAAQTAAARSAAQQLGQKGGLLDAVDNLTDPIRSITEPAVFSPNNSDNPVLAAGGNMTAGMTFVGQFLDHDVTLDLRSALQANADPARTNNFRTAAFDLDSLYGAGVGATVPGLPADGVQSLASRNLIRHVNFGLPSGQAIARRIGARALTATQLADLRPYRMESSTPLWFYILKEAELLEQGKRLGPVGSRIVGEVFIGLLKADSGSYLASQPAWRPTLPAATAGNFRMTDLLKLAGVVPPLQ